MGRFFSCILLSLMLLPAAEPDNRAQPVFFSMLFPQLMEQEGAQATMGEAVAL